jgi:hypothetical protein
VRRPKLHGAMEKFYLRSILTARIAALQQQQSETIEHAANVGWTREALAEHDSRSKFVTDLITHLENSHGE